MELINVNLPEDNFEIIKKSCLSRIKKEQDDLGKIKIAFIRLRNLDSENRLLLRQTINDGNPRVIIISTSENVASFAWKVGAFHYLEFPFTAEQLALMSHKITLLNKKGVEAETQLKLSYTGGFDVVYSKNINFIQGEGNYCKVFFRGKGGKIYTYRIKKFEEALINEVNFFKLTKSVFVNLNNISQIKGDIVRFIDSKTTLQLSTRSLSKLKSNVLWKNL